jgi:hypothetical protein
MVKTAVHGTRGGGGKNKQQRTRKHNTDAEPYITPADETKQQTQHIPRRQQKKQ